MLSDDTDRTEAIHIKHISHRWLQWLDEKIGKIQAENGGFFGLLARFEGESMPKASDITEHYRNTRKLND